MPKYIESKSEDNGFENYTGNENDWAFRVENELNVGRPGDGKESVFGEGDSFTDGLKVCIDDGGVALDVSEEAISKSGSTFGQTLGVPQVNDCIYFTTSKRDKDDIDYLKFYGIKAKIISALDSSVSGKMVTEYWNGTEWKELNTMSTDSGGRYFPHAKKLFERVGSDQIRFEANIQDLWVKSDPLSTGLESYWLRFRVTEAYTDGSSLQLEQIKLHSNRTEINDDGFIEYFGKARPIKLIPYSATEFKPANNSPANQDIYLGDKIASGMVENAFQANTTDRAGLVRPLPLDIDTSCLVKVIISWRCGSDDFTNPYRLTMRHAFSNEGSLVYTSTAGAPASAPNEKMQTKEFLSKGTNKILQTEFLLDVSDALFRKEGGPGDLLWFSIERSGDANASTLGMIQVEFQYVAWCAGGHQ